jgi:hypothetical protein
MPLCFHSGVYGRELLLDRAHRFFTESHSVVVHQSAIEIRRKLRAGFQHELECSTPISDTRYIEHKGDATRVELLHLLGNERRGFLVIQREQRLLALVAIVEKPVGFELEPGSFRERSYSTAARKCCPRPRRR